MKVLRANLGLLWVGWGWVYLSLVEMEAVIRVGLSLGRGGNQGEVVLRERLGNYVSTF